MKRAYEILVHLFIASAVIGVGLSYGKIYLFHVVLLLLLLLLGYNLVRPGISISPLPARYHSIFYMMFLWTLISASWSVSLLYTLYHLFYIFCGISVITAMIYYATDLSRQKKLFTVMSAVFLLEILFSLLEAFSDFRLPVSPYSRNVIHFGREMKVDLSLKKEVLDHIFSSPTGFQWNPNNLCTTMNIILPFFLFHRKLLTRIAGIAAVFTIILFADSRANMIAFMCILFAWVVFYQSSGWRVKFGLAAVPVIAVLLLNPLPRQFTEGKFPMVMNSISAMQHYLTVEADDSTSISARKQLMISGLNTVKETSGLGLGGGGFTAYNIEHGIKIGNTVNLHNFWLELLVDLGFIFTIPFLIWYMLVIFALYKIHLRSGNPDARYYASSSSLAMMGFIPGAVSASSAIYLLPMWLMFGFAIATINNHITQGR